MNLDPSHLFWQGIDPLVAISRLGDRVWHATAKDTLLDPVSIAANGVLDDRYERPDPAGAYPLGGSGSGALGDLGAHVFALAETLAGPIASVAGQSSTFVTERPTADDGGRRAVENDDVTHVLARFANGASGLFEASRVATGHAFDLSVEVVGSRGSIRFDQQAAHMLEVYLPAADGKPGGMRQVPAGPGHGDYAAFWPLAGIPSACTS